MKKAISAIRLKHLIAAAILLFTTSVLADTIVKPHTFYSGDPVLAAEVNENFDALFDQVNKIGGGITVDTDSNVGVGTETPEAGLHVVGTVKMLGEWATVSLDTSYEAPTDGFVVAQTIDSGWTNTSVSVFSDSADPPTTRRIRGMTNATCPVRKGDHWMVTKSGDGNVTLYWIPLGN
jgi:hypothetical protein